MDIRGMAEIPEYDSRVADIMLALSLDRPGNPAENEGKRPADISLADRKIPTTVEEFMEMEGLSEWPEHITSEYPIEHDPKSVCGDLEQIQDYLRTSAPLEEQLASLDALEKRIASLESTFGKYSDAILTNETRFSRIKQGIFYSNVDKLFMTEVDGQGAGQNLDKTTGSNRQVIAAGQLQEKKKKDVNFTSFPGFRPRELPELPGQLEAPQLLHRITNAQDFNAGFEKFWRKIFLSEASIAVVHDLFWWCFMRIFKPNTQVEQDQVFDRLADSFAALFFSIHPDTRDKIFKVYPGVLAQAIFMIFNDAFPESHRMFGPLFKEEVVCYCWELTTGTKPPPDTWSEWNLEGLQNKTKDGSDGKQIALTSTNLDGGLAAPKFDFEALYRSLDSLETEVRNGEIVQVKPAEVTKQNVQEKNKAESSYVGPGPQYEKVVFNLSGLSPLIAHFLNMKHLRDPKVAGRRVRRTEIKGQPAADKTFQDIIDEKKALTRANKAQYAKLCKETDDEILRIERKKALVTKEINKLKANPAAFKQAGLDVKFVTDRLMAKMEEDTKRASSSGSQMVTTAGEISLERDTESDNTDEELERIVEEEALCNPDIYGGGKHVLGGVRKDVKTYIKDKSKAAEYKKLKRQQKDIKMQFKGTKEKLKASTEYSI